MTVQSILEKKGGGIVSVGPEDTVAHAVAVLAEHKIGAAVVLDVSGTLVGILSERDIVRCLAEYGAATLERPVSALMTEDVQTTKPEEKADRVMERMSQGRFRHVPVMREGRLVGVVSIGDVVKKRLGDLEYEAAQLKQYIVAG